MKVLGIGSDFQDSKIVKFISQRTSKTTVLYYLELENGKKYPLDSVELILQGKL